MSTAERTEADVHPFLTAQNEAVSGLSVLPPLATVVDLTGDGDACLVVADLGGILRIQKGQNTIAELPLMYRPSGVVSYRRRPAPSPLSVAVGCSNTIYMYQYSAGSLVRGERIEVPDVPVCPEEVELWESLASTSSSSGRLPSNFAEVCEGLSDLQKNGNELTPQSRFLLLGFRDLIAKDKETFLADHIHRKLRHRAQVCAMATIPATTINGSATQLIVGSEHGLVYLLEKNLSFKTFIKIFPHTPFKILTWGALDADHRIVVLTREGRVYFIRNGSLMGTKIEFDVPIVDGTISGKYVYVLTADGAMSCWMMKGRKIFSIFQEENLYAISPFSWKDTVGVIISTATKLLFVGGGKQRYLEIPHYPCDYIFFGSFGRETGTLLTLGGSAKTVLMLPRKYEFAAMRNTASDQDIPMDLPEVSSLLLSFAEREKQDARAVHERFQLDLAALRLESAREKAKGKRGCDATLDVSVEGIGVSDVTIEVGREQAGHVDVFLLGRVTEGYRRLALVEGHRSSFTVQTTAPGGVLTVVVCEVPQEGEEGKVLIRKDVKLPADLFADT